MTMFKSSSIAIFCHSCAHGGRKAPVPGRFALPRQAPKACMKPCAAGPSGGSFPVKYGQIRRQEQRFPGSEGNVAPVTIFSALIGDGAKIDGLQDYARTVAPPPRPCSRGRQYGQAVRFLNAASNWLAVKSGKERREKP